MILNDSIMFAILLEELLHFPQVRSLITIRCNVIKTNFASVDGLSRRSGIVYNVQQDLTRLPSKEHLMTTHTIIMSSVNGQWQVIDTRTMQIRIYFENIILFSEP